MAKNRYAFRIDIYGGDVDPQAVGESLEDLIAAKQEHVTSEEIVAAARKTDSPMRACFDWDENLAAEKWRRKQAKNLIGDLMLADKRDDSKASKTRAFVYVSHPEHGNKRVLMGTRAAMARTEFREQVIEQAVRSLQRSLTYWAHAYGADPRLRSLAKDVAKLKARAERELLQAI